MSCFGAGCVGAGADSQSDEGFESRVGPDLSVHFPQNLAVVNYMADRVAVDVCRGIVEIAPCEVIMRQPVHPYTKKLLAAVPMPNLDHPLDFDRIGEHRLRQEALG